MSLSISFDTVQLPAGSSTDPDMAAMILADRVAALPQSTVKTIKSDLPKGSTQESMAGGVFHLLGGEAAAEFVGVDLLIVELNGDSSVADGLAALKAPGVIDRPLPVRPEASSEPSTSPTSSAATAPSATATSGSSGSPASSDASDMSSDASTSDTSQDESSPVGETPDDEPF